MREDLAHPRGRRPSLGVLAVLLCSCAGTTGADVVADGSTSPGAPAPAVSSPASSPTTGAASTAAGPGAVGQTAPADPLSSPAPPGAPGSAPTPAPGSSPLGSGQAVRIAFAGDMAFDGEAGDLLSADPSTVYGPIVPVLSDADLTVANLETAVTSGGGARADKQFAFQAPPSALDAVRAAGIDVVSMANNHGMDYGTEGLIESLAARDARGFPVIGIGRDEVEAFRPHVVTLKGQRIGVIGATQVLDGTLVDAWTAGPSQPGLASAKRVDRLVAEVTALRPQVDTLVVFLHWGTEKMTCPNDAQKELAPQLVDAGADIVVGGHAHRVQSGGYLGSAFVGYGLGNFLFAAHSEGGRKSGVLVVTATGRRIDGAEWKPARINDRHQPVPLEGADAAADVAAWNELRGCTDLADSPAALADASAPG